MGRLSAGAAQVTITPPLGVWMTGFGGRPSGCVGVRDDLLARALMLDDGDARVALVAIDVLTMDADLVERVRGLGRGAVGYLPDAGAYQEGGYEVEAAIRYYGNLMFAPAAAKIVCDGVVAALRSLTQSKGFQSN